MWTLCGLLQISHWHWIKHGWPKRRGMVRINVIGFFCCGKEFVYGVAWTSRECALKGFHRFATQLRYSPQLLLKLGEGYDSTWSIFKSLTPIPDNAVIYDQCLSGPWILFSSDNTLRIGDKTLFIVLVDKWDKGCVYFKISLKKKIHPFQRRAFQSDASRSCLLSGEWERIYCSMGLNDCPRS